MRKLLFGVVIDVYMTQPRSISVAQTCPVKGNVDANLDEHLRLTELAESEGAQLVVFPELSLTGYEMGLADALAFSDHDPNVSKYGVIRNTCFCVFMEQF